MVGIKIRVKIDGIKFVLLSSVIQLLCIPMFYWIGYGIGLIFHEPYIRIGSDGIDFYSLTLLYLTWLVIIGIVIITIFQEFIKNEIVITITHLTWFLFIIWMTIGDLKYRPYDYGLILLCVGSTIFTRFLIRRILHK
jgi:hypothetical protein